jgi:two-component sensor histidine kinase
MCIRDSVRVSLHNDGTELTVRVHDNGVGLPEEFAVDGSTLGLTIVRTLVTTELGGTITMTTDDGTLVDVRIPVSAGTR